MFLHQWQSNTGSVMVFQLHHTYKGTWYVCSCITRLELECFTGHRGF